VNRALFLDRDGVLDELVYYPDTEEWESPRRLDDLRLIEGASEPLRRFVDEGWLLFVVTNQPSYAKGKTTREDLSAVQDSVIARLAVPITRSYVCFHHPEALVEELRQVCDCRKPGTQFLRDAAREFHVDLTASWMAGDQDTDLLCGRSAGCWVALVTSRGSEGKRGSIEPDLSVDTLSELADLLLE
jgi:D-glycero-D-manno-heptose 1,7-bisphosphate phosphatase